MAEFPIHHAREGQIIPESEFVPPRSLEPRRFVSHENLVVRVEDTVLILVDVPEIAGLASIFERLFLFSALPDPFPLVGPDLVRVMSDEQLRVIVVSFFLAYDISVVRTG